MSAPTQQDGTSWASLALALRTVLPLLAGAGLTRLLSSSSSSSRSRARSRGRLDSPEQGGRRGDRGARDLTKFDIASVRFLFSSPFSPLRSWPERPSSSSSSPLPILPPEIVSLIFDYAFYHHLSTYSRFSHFTSSENADELYLRSAPLQCAGGRLKAVQVDTWSRDQGWSGDVRERWGTYDGSWTWFEVTLDRPRFECTAVPGREERAEPDQGREQERDRERERERGRGENEEDQQTEDWTEIHRCRATTNVHAGREIKKHTIRWESGCGEELLLKAREGDSIALRVRSRFPAWVNRVEGAQIRVYTAW